MEKRDLYDKNRQKTNEIILATEEIPENRYILVELILIQNSKRDILVQKRSQQKGGEYGLTAGHAKSGESSKQAIISEVKEELGLEISKEKIELIYSERDDKNRCFYDLYYLRKDIDISKLKLEVTEVESVKWCSKEEIKQMCAKGKFKKAHIEAFEILMNKLA